jgi:hypothetical protein
MVKHNGRLHIFFHVETCQREQEGRVVGTPPVRHFHELRKFMPGYVGLLVDILLASPAIVFVQRLRQRVEPGTEEYAGTENLFQGTEDLQPVVETANAFNIAYQLA